MLVLYKILLWRVDGAKFSQNFQLFVTQSLEVRVIQSQINDTILIPHNTLLNFYLFYSHKWHHHFSHIQHSVVKNMASIVFILKALKSS